MNCLNCGKETTNPKFCSSSCSAKVTNKTPKKKRTRKVRFCTVCKTETLNQKFCSSTCSGEAMFKETLKKFENGELTHDNTIKKCLSFTRKYCCEKCSNEGVHMGESLTLQLDHIDGNSDNNLPSNLRFLCPNCHSQTPTFCFKGRQNKNTKREMKRRETYALKKTRTSI